MKLYMSQGSGNAYKVRVLLALLKVPFEPVLLDTRKGEAKTPEYRRLNARGEVPVIVDGETVVWDSSACLVYVARKFGGEDWLPTAPAAAAQVQQWLALTASEIQFGLQYGRRGVGRNVWTAGTLEQCQALGRIALDTLEQRLAAHDWLVGTRPTIADLACFPYVETAPEGRMPLEPYPGVVAWLARCKALPGWPPR